MNIPNSVMKMVEKKPTDNAYFYKAEQAWNRLTDIKNNKIDYIDDDYSMLINTLERFYKGLLQSKLDNKEGYSLPPGFMTADHDFIKIVDEIERNFTSLYNIETQSDYRDRNNFLKDLRHSYTSSRYNENPKKEDFDKLYDVVKSQKELVYDYLLDNKNKKLTDFEQEENYVDL